MNATAAIRPRQRKSVLKNQKYSDDPEVILMLRVKKDDPGAFAELLRRNWSYVFGRCYRRLRDREDAEDLAQEVFLRVYRGRKTYEPRAKFSTWLFHITQNLLRNTIRSRRRRPCLRLDALACSPFLAEHLFRDDGESPTRPIERAELAKIVRTALSHLAHRQRTAVELQQFHNSTYEQVAAQMDMSPKAAKSLLYRARNQLRASLTSFMNEGL
ncbi:MAG TPA: RNA polymerase sigma factor [Gemmataceae bacterium]|nr:RNA polymerase sigma factor [Gemmataceae bacterium]